MINARNNKIYALFLYFIGGRGQRDENQKEKSYMDKEKGKTNLIKGDSLMYFSINKSPLFMKKHINANTERPRTNSYLCSFTSHPGPWRAM